MVRMWMNAVNINNGLCSFNEDLLPVHTQIHTITQYIHLHLPLKFKFWYLKKYIQTWFLNFYHFLFSQFKNELSN